MLDVELLGPPRVTRDGEPVEMDTRKAIAVLAYLLVEQSATRDTLAGLFWADSPQERARATLRRTLSTLRTAAGSDLIEADRNQVVLVGAVTSDVELLTRELEATTEHGHDPRDVCARCIPHLTRATGLYRGDFLEGFSVQGSAEFDDWVRSVAESTRMKVGEAFDRLATALAASGKYQAAIDAVTRWIDLDPLHEPAHRSLMLLHAWAGDRPGAVAAYRRCTAVLDTELGVPPLEETTELYEAILDEDLPPAPGVRRRIQAQAQADSAPSSTELIDREQEMKRLRSLLERVERTGEVVSVTGPAWMGKTRLLEELERMATDFGHQVLVGRAFRTEQGLPFGVAAQLFRSAIPSIQSSDDDLSGWALNEVARLVPELADGGLTSEVSDPFGELRLFDGAFTVLSELARRAPLIILIDDTQWLDPASAGLISYVSRRVSGSRVVLVVAARSGETLPELARELLGEAGTHLDLRPLTTKQLTPIAGSAEAAAALHERTGGVPLLVTEELADREAADRPEGMVRYMEARLAEVSDLARQVVAAAAVLSGVCDAGLLRETSGRSEEEVVEAVEDLVRAGLLREIGENAGLGFTLEALERLTYESTSLVRRRLLHRRAATALGERPHASTDPRVAAAIAAQLEGAGDPEAAGRYRTAAELSRRVYAHTEARSLYERALALGHSDAAEIHLAMGEIAMIVGDYEDALAELNAAAARAEGPTLAAAESRLGEVQRLLGRFELAEEHFARSADAEPTYAVYSDWALLRHRLGDVDGANQFASKAMELTGDAAPPGQLSRVHNIIGVVCDDPSMAAEHLDTALRLAGDDDLLRLAGLNNRAHLTAESGDLEGAIRMVNEAVGIAERTGNRHREAALHDHLADLHHRAGREDEANLALTKAVTLFSGIGTGDWLPEVWLLSRW